VSEPHYQEERMDEDIRIPALVEYLAQIPEYRKARGKRHPLLPLLLLVCVAMLCGARGQSAIADWGAYHGRRWLRRLGFTREVGPSQPTLSRLFQQVPHATVEAVLGRWAEQVLRGCPPADDATLEGIALDGKRLRGSARRGAVDAHLLSAYSQRLRLVLGQLGVPDKTNEIGAADELLLALVLEGRVVTADALLTQREIAQTILEGQGDYLLVVKENQPQLWADIAASFAPEADDFGCVGTAREVSAHGGRLEVRTLTASTALRGYTDWPGFQQALRVERRVVSKATGARLRQETAYAITSCAPQRATPAQLLALWRGHWAIENRLHYVRDVTFDEDRATVRAGHAPQVMAAFRNTAIGLLRLMGATNIAAACRRCAAQPAVALAALGLARL
jgi:predicted transposase YbfD/YdcC